MNAIIYNIAEPENPYMSSHISFFVPSFRRSFRRRR